MPLPKNAEQIANSIQSELTEERRAQIIEHLRACEAADKTKPQSDPKDEALLQIIKNGGDEGNFVSDLMKPENQIEHVERHGIPLPPISSQESNSSIKSDFRAAAKKGNLE